MVTVALINVVVALLAAFVAYGRRELAPYRDSPPVGAPARQLSTMRVLRRNRLRLVLSEAPAIRVSAICKRLARSASRVAVRRASSLMLDTLCEIDEVAARASAVGTVARAAVVRRHHGMSHQICSGNRLHAPPRPSDARDPNTSGLGVLQGTHESLLKSRARATNVLHQL